MMIPTEFNWLKTTNGPRMVVEAVKLYGIIEVPGPADNPIILEWARETGLDKKGYNDDEIPWCGLFMAVVAQRAGKSLPPEPLRALSWAGFGLPSPEPSLGDVLVFKRRNQEGAVIGGHVALYVSEDSDYFYMLGGNQGDAVSISRKLKSALHACRRPAYKTTPVEVRPVRLGGQLIAGLAGNKEV